MTAAAVMLAALRVALKQIEDLDDVLNQPGHDVYGWHMNGAPEPVGNFFTENDHGAVETIRAAIAAGEKETRSDESASKINQLSSASSD